MAGLLDIFGTSGAETMGLLGMSPEDVARSREEAQAQALFALAGRLFKGGSGGASIVEGLQQGQQAYKTAMQGGLQEQLQKAQLKEMIRKREEDEVKRQLERQALMRQQAVQTEIEKAYRPETFADTPLTNLMGQEIAGPNMPQAAGIGMEALAPKLMATKEGRAALKDLQPEYKEVNGVLYEITAGMPPKLVAGTKKRDTVTVGNVVLDKETMQPIYTAPEAPAASIKEFQDFSKLNATEKAAYLKLQDQKRPVTNVNVSTEGERKASLFQEQMKAASGTIASLGPVDMSNLTNQAAFKGAGGMANIVVDPKIQQYKQAADQWSESYLRVKTGAAATPAEVELNNRTFFPAIGDNTETVKLKERMRRKAEQDLGIMAGRAEVKNPNAMPQVSEQPLDSGVLIPAGVTVRKK
jgi:hypothetical protein